jgi:hypothetical protein
MSYIYLASPYADPDEVVRQERADLARRACAKLMLATGKPIFSPICHSHGLADYLPEPLRHSHDFWTDMDLPLLTNAVGLAVLQLPGWTESRGVLAEIAFATKHKIPVEYLPADY